MRNDDKKSPNQSEMVVSTSELADLLGLSPRRIQQLAQEGMFPKVGRGRFKAADSVRNYIKSVQSADGGVAEVDYLREKALHERAKREKAELQLGVMKGEMHRSEDIKTVMNDMIMAFRSRVLAMPSKLAPQVAEKTDIASVLRLLTSEVYEALTELSTYDPHVFYAKNSEYVEMEDDEED